MHRVADGKARFIFVMTLAFIYTIGRHIVAADQIIMCAGRNECECKSPDGQRSLLKCWSNIHVGSPIRIAGCVMVIRGAPPLNFLVTVQVSSNIKASFARRWSDI